MVRRLPLIALGLWVVTPTVALAQPFFRMNCGAGGSAFPRCGWGEFRSPNPQGITNTYVSNAFSDNSEGVRWNIDNGLVQFQPSYGWYNVGHPLASQGDSRYIRAKYKRTAGSTGSGAAKFLMLEAQPNEPARVNCEIAWSNSPGFDRFRCTRNVDGDPNRTVPNLNLAIGTEYWIQIRATSATTSSSSDGTMSIWLNNCSFGTPQATITGVDLEVANGWPQLENACCYTPGSGTIEYVIGDITLDDEFDSTWCPGGASSRRPLPPSGVQVR